MKQNLLLCYLLSIFLIPLVTAQNLDHRQFLKDMETSSEDTYERCLELYDDYLLNHPDDILTMIEKCKFIDNALYDDYEEYNPNQSQFDSCVALLSEKYSNHPDVITYQTSYTWGEDQLEVFQRAEYSIMQNIDAWSDENLSAVYMKMSQYYYWEEDYNLAYEKALERIKYDPPSKYSQEYVKILIELDKEDEAIEVLLAIEDTSKFAWKLSQKADLLLQLKAYDHALKLYSKINDIDSTFNNNTEISNALEEVGEYLSAREYLVKDTSQNWNSEQAVQNLMLHDLQFQDGEKSKASYNAFRDFGYTFDPLAIYRLKLFFKDPSQGWKFRDLLGLLSLLALLLLIIIIPSIWILPVYFIGVRWKFVEKNKSFKTAWGLKAFWFVSSAYLFASVVASFIDLDAVYSYFDSSIYIEETSTEELGLMTLLFMFLCAVFGLMTLYKKKLIILLSTHWSIVQSILVGIGLLIAFKAGTSIYMKIGMAVFDLSLEDITGFSKILLSSKEEISSIVEIYGKWVALLTVGIMVPIYEEIIFRGVIFDACRRYLNSNSANVIQAVLFGAVHMDLFLFPVFFAFGIITGILRKESGGLLSGIVFHSVNNIIAIWAIMLL